MRIAAVGSTGTAFGYLGVSTLAGVKLAVQQINDDGGFEVDGKRYTFALDTAEATDTPAQAVAAAQGVIRDHKPIAMFGPTASPIATAVDVITERSKVLHFTACTACQAEAGKPSAPYLLVTKLDPELEQKVWIEALQQQFPGIKSVTVLEPDDAGGQSIAGHLDTAAKAAGLTSNVILYPPQLINYSSLVTKLQRQHPDVVAAGDVPGPIEAILKEAHAAGVGRVYTSQASCIDDLFAELKNYACYSYGVDMLNPTDDAGRTYVQEYTKFTGKEADANSFWSLTSYPFVFGLVQAMQAAQTTTDTAAIAKEMSSMSYTKVFPIRFTNYVAQQPLIVEYAVDGKRSYISAGLSAN